MMTMILIIHFEEDNFESYSNQTYASLDNDFDYLKNRNDSTVSKRCSKETSDIQICHKIILHFACKDFQLRYEV